MEMTDEQQDEQFYRDTESIAFPKLNDHQLSLLEPLAKRRVLKRGDLLFKAGQRDIGLTIVLRGEIEASSLGFPGVDLLLPRTRSGDPVPRDRASPGDGGERRGRGRSA